MTPAPSNPTRPQRLHLAATLAALVAIGALYVNASAYPGLLVTGAAILAAHFIPLRLPRHPLAVWPVRILLFSIVISNNYEDRSRVGAWFLDPGYFHLFGYLCALELIIQVWQRYEKNPPRGEALLLSALIMATATNTYDPRYVRWFAPAFMLFIALSLRGFRTRAARTDSQRLWTAAGPRTAALLVALLIGFFCAIGLKFYGEKVTIYPMTRMFKKSPISATGISTQPRLGPSMDMQPPPVRVLKIAGRWPGGHLRGMSFDTYHDGGWNPGFNERRFVLITPALLNASAPGQRMTLTRLTDDANNLLYVPLSSTGIIPMPDSKTDWVPLSDHTLRSNAQEADTYQYEVIPSISESHQGPLCAPLSDDERQRCLAIPDEIDPRVRDLARQITAGLAPPRRVQAIEQYLQANHAYSLTYIPGDGDPVNDFLLNKRSASCQFFASAAAILLRCADIPARFVNGYYAHETAGKDTLVVRQRDAHAWVECWLDDVGWITLDATPASGRPDQAFSDVGAWQRWRERFGDWMTQLRQWLWNLNWTLLGAVGVSGVAMFYAGQWWWNRLLRRRPTPLQRPDYRYPNRELADLARHFEKLLRRRGLPCPPTRTWREHVAGPDLPEHLTLARSFVHEYELVRFGGQDTSAALQRLRTMLQQLEQLKR